MPDFSNVAALDVLIGLAFLYFLLSLVCSAIAEGIAQALNLRARDLTRGLRNLLENPERVDKFYNHPRVQALFKPEGFFVGARRPSYIPSRVFALTLLDTVAPEADDGDSRNLIGRAEAAAASIQNPRIASLLRDALSEARGDIDALRSGLERSFNEVMDRTSGWYKRRVQVILFFIALAVVGAMNADSFAIGQRLWKDDSLRAAVVAQAQNQQAATDCPQQGRTGDRPDRRRRQRLV